MIELLSMFNGTNNGAIFLSVRDATDRLGFTDYRPTIDAFQELQDAGLISLTFAGHFAIKTGEVSKAHAWRLNFVDGDGRPVGEATLPTIDLNTLRTKAQQRMAKRQKVLKRYLKDRHDGKLAVGESTTLDARSVVESTTVTPDRVVESTTGEPENGGNSLVASVGESTAHISYHSQGEESAPVTLIRELVSAWWRTAAPKDRLRLAAQHDLQIGELIAFIQGNDLPFPKLVAIRSTIRGDRAAA